MKNRCFYLLFFALSITACLFSDDAWFAPNENLVAEGIPLIPSLLVQSVARYSDFRAATLAGWHPIEREMLISTRFADVPEIHFLKMPAGARTQLTFFADAVTQARFEPEKADYFVFSKDVGGGEFYQLYRYNLETGEVGLLTDGNSRNTDMVWAHGGGKLAYSSTRRNGKDVDIWVMNPGDRGSDHILAQLDGGGWQALDWSPNDQQLLLRNEISSEESYLWLMEVNSGLKSLLTSQSSGRVHYGTGLFSKDGKGIYLTTDKDSEFHRLAYLDLASKKYIYLTDKLPWDIEQFDLSEDGRLIALVSNEDGFGVLHVLDTRSGKERTVPPLPQGVISGVLWHKNSRDLGFAMSSATSSSDVYSLNVETGKLERWTFSETGGLNTAMFAAPQLIHWKSWDGRAISGFLYRPGAKFSGKHPVVINIHGGPEGQFRPAFLGRSNYYINELGVAMIFPNVRGSTGYGKSFLSLDNGVLREGSYRDIGSLLAWIQTQPDLDSQRVMVTGGSYGGFMTLEVATNYNDRICCSVDVVGPSNLVSFLEHTSGYRQDLRRVEYGDERDPGTRQFLERIAPLNNAKNITKPLFVIAGKNDPRVPASESQQMVEVVRKNGTPVWWLLAKDEGHGFRKKKNADYQFYATVMFMKQYLLK